MKNILDDIVKRESEFGNSIVDDYELTEELKKELEESVLEIRNGGGLILN
jgi:predicted house-cleaning noncanonical NTP pyrophosphatase (MazG superfamily)